MRRLIEYQQYHQLQTRGNVTDTGNDETNSITEPYSNFGTDKERNG
jgi:hypothetical protein